MTKENERDATALRIGRELFGASTEGDEKAAIDFARRLYAEWQKASEPAAHTPIPNLQETVDYYDVIIKNAPIDDTEWDFVMTAAEYRLLRTAAMIGAASPPAAPNAAQQEANAGTPRTMQQLLDEVQDYTRWQLVQRMGQAERDRNTAERDLASATAKVAQWKAGGSMGTIAQWKLDAERYRWLQMEIARGDVKVGYFPYCLSKVQSPKEMNDAIDAAMLEAKEPK